MESNDFDEQKFKEYLDELYGDVDICGLPYPAGQTLQDVDPIAFDVAFYDYISEYELNVKD